jgi:hypothetical protein
VQQLLLHLLFDAASQAESGCGLATADAMRAASELGHAGHTAMLACDPSAMASMSMPGIGMWAAHLVATAATAWLLARGEAWLWRVADRIIRASAAHPDGWPDSAPRPVPESRRAAGPRPRAHRPAAPRGPPVVLFAS